ncbi:hypothetical protein [Sedimentibacter sp. MB31-C6]|uniref:hypothetical protein n=1 Tax=Sedimentibacter sp. MB31-C6 TaxID=3109366 RepID=UPI002DDD58A3|nr:hypothetical protein [Sedimentibacter sp. MB36-C1]WSI03606.1 hypothetical protein U8307_11165 [Sedimentibacter sp. MB36-C1]
MLFFRMGPRCLFIRSEKIDEITSFLETKLNGEITDYQQGIKRASEYSTLCFITGINHEKTYVQDAKKIVLVNNVASGILSSIINSHACALIHKIDMGPTSIVMRIPGNEQKLIGKLKVLFDGKEVDLVDGIGLGEKDDTILIFTNKVLSGPITDVLATKLLIPQSAIVVQERLRLEGLRLITQSLDDSQWYELRINIYDSYGKYEENYDRLMFILSKLEIGMVLGESWTKDYAVMLYSVLTYQVRLFTFFTPQEVKRILMALEYTNDGKRLVDFDLYYKNKKVYWSDVHRTKKGKNKLEEVKEYRQSLYEKLKLEDIKILEEMDKELEH